VVFIAPTSLFSIVAPLRTQGVAVCLVAVAATMGLDLICPMDAATLM
jgi:hypothetical protein